MFLGKKAPLWMGIVNLAPDSFSDGGLYNTTKKAIEKCTELVRKGAHIIDFGGVSSNPKIKELTVPPKEELERVYSTIKEARKTLPSNILISIDTFSPKVAFALAEEKLIDIINDIYSAQKEERVQNLFLNTAKIAAQFNLGLILMHMPPSQNPPHSNNESCMEKIINFLKERIEFCKKMGVQHLAIDPGIGYGRFGKSFADILEILKEESIHKLCQLDASLLIGVSRKSFHLDIDSTLIDPLSRDSLSKKIELKCIANGAQIIRTHNL